jgi:hypothetical protein
VSLVGEKRKVYKALVGKSKGKRPLGRPRRRWRMESEWILGRLDGGVMWIQLAQDRDRWRSVVKVAINLRVLVPRS